MACRLGHWKRTWQLTLILAWRTPGTEEPGGVHEVAKSWTWLSLHAQACSGFLNNPFEFVIIHVVPIKKLIICAHIDSYI